MSWRRGQAYAQHLRDRVLAAVDRGMGVYQAAPVFQVSVSWIYKALARRRHSGETTARPQVNHVPPKLYSTRRCWDQPLRRKRRQKSVFHHRGSPRTHWSEPCCCRQWM